VRPKDIASEPLYTHWVDASFAPDVEINKGKSTIGWFGQFLGATVSWRTAMTTRVCTSSTEAECSGLDAIRKENQYHENFHFYVGVFLITGPALVNEDNSAAVTLSGENVFHKRSRHFSIEWYATREAVERNQLRIQWVDTKSQAADVLTKALQGASFVIFRGRMMGVEALQIYFGHLGLVRP
jgi:hypothetical protein